MRRLAIVAVVVLAACWGDVAPPPPVVATQPRAPATLAGPPRPVRTTWRGYYTCAQGVTALELVIETRGGDATAVFTFGPIDTNPAVPHGSYSMTGTMQDRDGKLSIALDPDAWIEQPPGYVMVGVRAASTDRVHLHGRINQPSCGALEATLAE